MRIISSSSLYEEALVIVQTSLLALADRREALTDKRFASSGIYCPHKMQSVITAEIKARQFNQVIKDRQVLK